MNKRMINIAEHGVHEAIATQLYWGEDDRADEFEIVLLYNNDQVYHRRAFGGPADMEMDLSTLANQLHKDCGIELSEIEY